jgi:hypothetical protein
MPDHVLQGWEDLLVGQIAGGTKEDQGVGDVRAVGTRARAIR